MDTFTAFWPKRNANNSNPMQMLGKAGSLQTYIRRYPSFKKKHKGKKNQKKFSRGLCPLAIWILGGFVFWLQPWKKKIMVREANAYVHLFFCWCCIALAFTDARQTLGKCVRNLSISTRKQKRPNKKMLRGGAGQPLPLKNFFQPQARPTMTTRFVKVWIRFFRFW